MTTGCTVSVSTSAGVLVYPGASVAAFEGRRPGWVLDGAPISWGDVAVLWCGLADRGGVKVRGVGTAFVVLPATVVLTAILDGFVSGVSE